MSGDLDLDAIEARANAATEGPWEAQQNTYRDGYVETYFITGAECSFHALRSESDAADAEFIAYARTDVPALVAEVRSLREANESLGSMLEWQAEVIIDTRDALRVGGCTEHVLTAEQAGALEAATRILARERNADPSRYDLAIRERDDARAAIARVRALHVSVERPESEHYYCEPEECDQAGVGGMETVCDVCERLYPCATIRALDVRHDPSATTEGEHLPDIRRAHVGEARSVWCSCGTPIGFAIGQESAEAMHRRHVGRVAPTTTGGGS